ncbi:hypothetical protein Msil_3178 [Methylocella silvestris BL2]|uniref:Uncharacterized protein n=1 Tax=Methylocella silvestris (strain DSM 15510 / CIP 108128 / LMG 27833 / NCIMB 13906 / BL2) TaxID=395965 RepID=B8EMF8_METSB|nr:hypothetical protein Msil_3178 [Methylocella silvestris BL2]
MNQRAQIIAGPSFASILCWREACAWLAAFGAVVAIMSGLLYAGVGIQHKKFGESARVEMSPPR